MLLALCVTNMLDSWITYIYSFFCESKLMKMWQKDSGTESTNGSNSFVYEIGPYLMVNLKTNFLFGIWFVPLCSNIMLGFVDCNLCFRSADCEVQWHLNVLNCHV